MLSPQRRFFSCIRSDKSAITPFSRIGQKIGDFIALPYNEIARLTKSTGRFRIYYRFHFYYVKNRTPVFINADQAICSASAPSPCKNQRIIKIAGAWYRLICAGMAELADVQDLGSCAERRVGSTPTTRTTLKAHFRYFSKMSLQCGWDCFL